MAIIHGHGNPNWNRDETILALDLYFDFAGVIPSGEDGRVKSLSQLLRSMPYHANASKKDSFRNADGVSFKLQNLRQVATGKGLGNVSNMDRIIWNEFANKPDEVKKQANLIKAGIKLVEMESEDSDDDLQFAEGRIVTEAHMALTHRQPPAGLVFHSDRGVQYASHDYRHALQNSQAIASMSRKANCYDNAAMESFWSTLKQELIYRRHFKTRNEARQAIFDFIEVFYNRRRLHSSLGYCSPIDFETQNN